MFGLDAQELTGVFDPTAVPNLKLGAKVCLTYDRNPEIYVVVGAAFGPDHPALESKGTQAITDDLAALAVADSKENANAPVTPTEQLAELVNPPDHGKNFIYLVVPVSGPGVKGLKPTIDLGTAKTVLEKNLSVPPRFVAGRIFTVNVPIDRRGNMVAVPVEIASVQRGLGFSAGAGAVASVANGGTAFNAPWEDLWKYKLVHSGAWVSEEALGAVVDAQVESLIVGQVNWL